MKYPERLIGSIAAHASQLADRHITERTILLALGFKFRAEKGQTLNEVCDHFDFTRAYGRSIARQFAISFPDYEPANPQNLPLE